MSRYGGSKWVFVQKRGQRQALNSQVCLHIQNKRDTQGVAASSSQSSQYNEERNNCGKHFVPCDLEAHSGP